MKPIEILVTGTSSVHARPLAYRVIDAGKMLGVGRTTIFEMIKDGRLAAKEIGGATVVSHAELQRIFDEAPDCDATVRARMITAGDYPKPIGPATDAVERMEAEIAADQGNRRG